MQENQNNQNNQENQNTQNQGQGNAASQAQQERNEQARDISSTFNQGPHEGGIQMPELPTVELPEGGGAIQGIGEKFQANPVTGTGSLTVPIAMSPGRGGFSPELQLSYDSGSGNSPYGMGWNVGLPSITRKTQKELPQYRDKIESDTFILSGAEDLVCELDGSGDPVVLDDPNDSNLRIHRYVPRVEGLFARIERLEHKDSGLSHWRTISKDNRTSIYGESSLALSSLTPANIADPSDTDKVFQWFLEKTYDEKGNYILYEYKKEDGEGVSSENSFEKNRLSGSDAFNKVYLKSVFVWQ